jgi:hypothetical protein
VPFSAVPPGAYVVQSVAMNEVGHCCFCFDVVNVRDDGVFIRLSRPDRQSFQQLFAHTRCVASRLHSRVPFDEHLFDD